MILADDLPETEVHRRLALFATASIDRQNKNIQAISAAFGKQDAQVLDQIPFKSQNRFSAVRSARRARANMSSCSALPRR